MFHDHLGSMIAATEADGTVLQLYRYDLWGKRRDAGGPRYDDSELSSFVALVTQRSYTGHEYLDEVGLIHMNGRVYDPTIARFLSADPIIQAPTDLQSLNRYAYVRNNPLRYTDPSGYSWLSREWRRAKRSAKNFVCGNSCGGVFKYSGQDVVNLMYYGGNRNKRKLRRWAARHPRRASNVFGVISIGCGILGGPAGAAACSAGGTYNVARAQGASKHDAQNAAARAGAGAYLMAVAGGGNRGGTPYGQNWFQTGLIMGTAGGLSASIQGGNFNDGFKISFIHPLPPSV